MTVDKAAPKTPHLKTNIKTASKIVFVTTLDREFKKALLAYPIPFTQLFIDWAVTKKKEPLSITVIYSLAYTMLSAFAPYRESNGLIVSNPMIVMAAENRIESIQALPIIFSAPCLSDFPILREMEADARAAIRSDSA